MNTSGGAAVDPRTALLALYDTAVPQVYGYLLSRGRDRDLAEDLTAETFLAAADAVCRTSPPAVEVGWLIGVARHKLADHWRRQAREQRNLHAVASDPTLAERTVEPADAHLDRLQAQAVLDALAPQHRAALTLRYLDDLPVAQVAALLGRTVEATEALLVRARREFRAVHHVHAAREEEDRD